MNAKPWYQSATTYALAVSIVTKLLIMAGLAETEAGEKASTFITGFLPVAGIAFDVIAGWARKRAQGPLTLTKAGAEAKNAQSGYARPLMLALLLAIAVPVAAVLPGCATTSPQTKLILETTTRMAVRRAIAESPNPTRALEKAANIRTVAERLKGVATSESTILGLRDEVLLEIARLDLAPLDRADAVDLVNLFAAILQEQYGDELSGDERLVKVREFLDIVLATLPA